MKKYPATYKDRRGAENTEIFSNGSRLFLILRGISFSGTDFELLEGEIDEFQFEYEKHSDGSATLTNFKLEVDFLIQLTVTDDYKIVHLKAQIATGGERESHVYLKLNTTKGVFKNTKSYGFFEDALIEIQHFLPERVDIKTCLSCRYSNYHPVGNGMFGGLYCFKKVKAEAEMISNKYELMALWEKAVIEQKLFNVNEVFLCSEYELVKKGDWTYKSYPAS